MKNNFRNYTIDENVKELYKNLRTNQTVDYVKNSLEKYCNFIKGRFDLHLSSYYLMKKLKNFFLN